jgi:hypothetical protein
MYPVPTYLLVLALASALAALVSLSLEGPLPWNAGIGAGLTLGLIVLALLSWAAIALRAAREGLLAIAIFVAACAYEAVPGLSWTEMFDRSLRRFGAVPTIVAYLILGVCFWVLSIRLRRKMLAEISAPEEGVAGDDRRD